MREEHIFILFKSLRFLLLYYKFYPMKQFYVQVPVPREVEGRKGEWTPLLPGLDYRPSEF